jgi:hypothetical protein
MAGVKLLSLSLLLVELLRAACGRTGRRLPGRQNMNEI